MAGKTQPIHHDTQTVQQLTKEVCTLTFFREPIQRSMT